MVKSKDVSVTEYLDVLRRVTMKRFGESISATYSSKSAQKHVHKPPCQWRPRDHKEKACKWCSGEPHARNVCPANEAKCTFCQKKG